MDRFKLIDCPQQLLLVRSSVEVARNAEELFNLLVSPEGYGILDDTTYHTDAPVEVLQWRDRYIVLLCWPSDDASSICFLLLAGLATCVI